jgi:hypothetical protein
VEGVRSQAGRASEEAGGWRRADAGAGVCKRETGVHRCIACWLGVLVCGSCASTKGHPPAAAAAAGRENLDCCVPRTFWGPRRLAQTDALVCQQLLLSSAKHRPCLWQPVVHCCKVGTSYGRPAHSPASSVQSRLHGRSDRSLRGLQQGGR